MSEPPVVASVSRLVDQARVDRYAAAARDPNPIHRDTPEAAASQFGRPVAHGMLILGIVCDAMAAAFGERWASSGSLRVRFRAPALPPVTVTASATLKSAEAGVATYEITAEDEHGAVLISGTASAHYE